MTELKIVINDTKTGKSYAKTAEDDSFLGLRLGSKIKGDVIGLDGYELEISGGSDNAGFPMVRKVNTTARKRVLLTCGPGIKIKTKGAKIRKSIRGSIIADDIKHLNLKVIKYGSKSLEESLGIAPKEEKKE
ncbi:30S ribosomal protein S6e [Candidatus Woesearchaeota archaeon]|nr:30S ribosomal protein S6e [Candidatus Woesearchaeota archaeon]